VHLVRIKCPKIVFISKTSQQSDRVRNLKRRLALDNGFVVDGKGKGGGLALYWDNSIKLTVLSYGMHHIDTLIWDSDHQAACAWYFCIWRTKSAGSTYDVGIVKTPEVMLVCPVVSNW
jgi:hypothetical protein